MGDGKRLKKHKDDAEKQHKYLLYPRDDNNVIEKHKIKIKDPYAKLETDNKDYIKKQKNFYEYYSRRTELYEYFNNRLKDISKCEIRYLPILVGSEFFFLANNSSHIHHILYKTNDINDKNPKLVFDFNTIENSKDYLFVYWTVSPDGKYIVYCYREYTKDYGNIIIKGVNNNKNEYYIIRNAFLVDTEIAWYKNGFFYGSRNNETTLVLYHKIHLKTGIIDNNKDELYLKMENNNLIPIPIVSDDKKYLFLSIISPNQEGNLLYFLRLKRDKKKFYKIVTKWGRIYKFIVNFDKDVYILTSKKASRNRIVKINMHNRKPKCHCEWLEYVSKHKFDYLYDAAFAGGEYLILQYTYRNIHYFSLYSIKNEKFIQIEQNYLGTIKFRRLYNINSEFFYFSFESFHLPPRILLIDIKNKNTLLIYEPKMNYLSEKDFYADYKTFQSSDKRYNIPVYIVGTKNQRDKPRPCLLLVNGGFAETLWPKFNPYLYAFFVIFGGIIAVSYIRGGGEFGRKWQGSGRLRKKSKGIQDFIGTCKFLISNAYTTRNMLIAEGITHGGYIVVTAMLKKPKILALVISINPITDLINFINVPARNRLICEFGNPEKNAQEVKRLLKLSPYHFIKPPKDEFEEWPAVAFVCVKFNKFVAEWQPLKLCAQMQYEASKIPEIQIDPVLVKPIDELARICDALHTEEMINYYAEKYTLISLYSAVDKIE